YRTIERNRKHLIRPAGTVIPIRTIDHIVEIATLSVPESIVECALDPECACLEIQWRRTFLRPELVDPTLNQTERIEPERVDLHRLASPRCDDPIVDFRVHPGELISIGPLTQKAVVLINTNTEARAFDVASDDLDEGRQQQAECVVILRDPHVTINRVKNPQRRIGRVIEAFARAVGKHVRDEAVADVMAERAENVPGFAISARRERQSLEADHGVAAPIGEPVITRDYG